MGDGSGEAKTLSATGRKIEVHFQGLREWLQYGDRRMHEMKMSLVWPGVISRQRLPRSSARVLHVVPMEHGSCGPAVVRWLALRSNVVKPRALLQRTAGH